MKVCSHFHSIYPSKTSLTLFSLVISIIASAAFSDLADSYDLLKLGGSDYHARGGNSESALGSVSLPVVAVHEFLKVARPIWCGAIKNTVDRYLSDPTDSNLDHILRYAKTKLAKSGISVPFPTIDHGHSIELIGQCLSQWLTNEEQKNTDFEAIRLKLPYKEGNLEALKNST